MSVGSSVQQMKESFEAQFDDAGENRYLYRRNQKGEAIPVTAEERDRFIRQYVRRIWFILGGMMAVLLVFWGVVIWWTISDSRNFPDTAMYVGTVVIAAVPITLMYWIRGAPARELEGRTPVGRERSSDEMKAIFFKKTSYGQLAGAAAFGLIVPLMMGFGKSPVDVFHGWGRLWWILGGALALFVAIQAFRKWRFESEPPNDAI
jgi:hypothetical protein